MVTYYQGLELTTDSADAAAAYSRTVRSYLAFGMEAGVHMKAALATDGEMAMTLINRGYFFHLFAIPALARKAVEAAAASEQAIASRGATSGKPGTRPPCRPGTGAPCSKPLIIGSKSCCAIPTMPWWCA
ncbi:MAG: hypothetical protein VCE75_16500 [Alphaproteobacteria bacterium]